MREILFRGKRIDNGEWVEGHYGEYMLMSEESIPCISIPNKEAICGSTCYDVDPDTVGMCVPGITDNNGKKIFEGDILSVLLDFEHGRTIKGIVEYKIDCFRIKYNNPNGVGALTLNPISYERNHIIIGNIYDNPELLEVER